MLKVAKAFIFNEKGQILILVRSSTHPRYPFGIDLPGGIVENNESSRHAAIREIREEIGIKTNHLKLLFKQPSSDGKYIHILYEMQISPNEDIITISWEHSGYKWMDIKELLDATNNNIDVSSQNAINYLRSNLTKYLN